MPVDRGTTVSEVLELAARFGALGLVFSGLEAGALEALTPAGGARSVLLPGGLALVALERGRAERRDYRGAAALKLTSGSTGLPKATFTTDQQLLHDSRHIVEGMGIRPDDVQLGLIPLSHAYGLGQPRRPGVHAGHRRRAARGVRPLARLRGCDRTWRACVPGCAVHVRASGGASAGRGVATLDRHAHLGGRAAGRRGCA